MILKEDYYGKYKMDIRKYKKITQAGVNIRTFRARYWEPPIPGT
jgi:hypothetical protein